MGLKTKNILIISDSKEQRKTLKSLLEDNEIKDIEFKTHAITFKECMSHRLNEPMVDLIIIRYDVIDHILSYLLRAIKDKKIILVLSREPTAQQAHTLKDFNVVETFIDPFDVDEFVQKITTAI